MKNNDDLNPYERIVRTFFRSKVKESIINEKMKAVEKDKRIRLPEEKDIIRKAIDEVFDLTALWPYSNAIVFLNENSLLPSFVFEFKKEDDEIIDYAGNGKFVYSDKETGLSDINDMVEESHKESFIRYGLFRCYYYPLFDNDFKGAKPETIGSTLFIMNFPGFDISLVKEITPEKDGSISICVTDAVRTGKGNKTGVLMNLSGNYISYYCIPENRKVAYEHEGEKITDCVMNKLIDNINDTFKQ